MKKIYLKFVDRLVEIRSIDLNNSSFCQNNKASINSLFVYMEFILRVKLFEEIKKRKGRKKIFVIVSIREGKKEKH